MPFSACAVLAAPTPLDFETPAVPQPHIQRLLTLTSPSSNTSLACPSPPISFQLTQATRPSTLITSRAISVHYVSSITHTPPTFLPPISRLAAHMFKHFGMLTAPAYTSYQRPCIYEAFIAQYLFVHSHATPGFLIQNNHPPFVSPIIGTIFSTAISSSQALQAPPNCHLSSSSNLQCMFKRLGMFAVLVPHVNVDIAAFHPSDTNIIFRYQVFSARSSCRRCRQGTALSTLVARL